MDLFQNTLREALEKNETETENWTKHKDEMVQAETSLREFQKKLTVDIMVPIGSKALMPGYLYHTGEVLVGHGNKTFSKCTTLQAIKICKHRQNYASTRLEELETERNLYRNKLELPFANEAFASGGEEIIEEYDEEKETLWREEHRKRVAESKKKEAEERKKLQENDDRSHDDIMNLLDELELMEDLDVELEQMDVSSDEQLKKLMTGELKPPEKKRTAHKKSDPILGSQPKSEDNDESSMQPSNNISPPPKPPRTFASCSPTSPQKLISAQANTQIHNDSIQVKVAVNGPRAPGPSYEKYETSVVAKPDSPPPSVKLDSESEVSDDEGILSDQVQAQWKKIQEETKAMNKKQKEKYLKKKLKEVVICIRDIEVHDERTLDIKLDLEELQELLKDELIRLESNTASETTKSIEPVELEISTSTASDLKEEPVTSKETITKVDMEPSTSKKSLHTDVTEVKKKRKSKISFANEDEIKLINKFEAPIKISEPVPHESNVTEELSRPNILEIKVKFSKTESTSLSNAATPDEIISPSDIYEKILKPFCSTTTPEESNSQDISSTKSILKNKEKVLEEVHIPEKLITHTDRKKPKKTVMAVKDVLGDVMERKVEYEDVTTKDSSKSVGSKSEVKVSRFKSNRASSKK